MREDGTGIKIETVALCLTVVFWIYGLVKLWQENLLSGGWFMGSIIIAAMVFMLMNDLVRRVVYTDRRIRLGWYQYDRELRRWLNDGKVLSHNWEDPRWVEARDEAMKS